MSALQQFIEREIPKVNAALYALLDRSTMPASLKESMHYSIEAGGKRVRPLLVLAVLEDALQADERVEERYAVAAAIELIHTYSLIHDDLPAMDDDDYRRGKLTNHKKFGEAMAILAGDAMQAMAFQSIAEAASIPADIRVELVQLLAKASGADGMVGGQVLDLEGETRQLSLEELEHVHIHKTGALLTYSIEAGAILARMCEHERSELKRYARHIGLAFQIKDDILDVTSTTEQLGKPANSDEASEKSTYPAILGLEQSEKQMQAHYEQAIDAIAFFQEDSYLHQFAHYIVARDL
ncbi:MAG TPA: farnesyl diphosphate synthase [Savagea sp.]